MDGCQNKKQDRQHNTTTHPKTTPTTQYHPRTRIPTTHPPTHTTEALVRRTQEEFLVRVTRGLPPSMTFVYAIGNNDLWPNNKNSAHNFEVGFGRVCVGCVCGVEGFWRRLGPPLSCYPFLPPLSPKQTPPLHSTSHKTNHQRTNTPPPLTGPVRPDGGALPRHVRHLQGHPGGGGGEQAALPPVGVLCLQVGGLSGCRVVGTVVGVGLSVCGCGCGCGCEWCVYCVYTHKDGSTPSYLPSFPKPKKQQQTIHPPTNTNYQQTPLRDPATALRTLVLNSGLWSGRYDNADLPKAAPAAHMAWVKAQLQAAAAAKEKVGVGGVGFGVGGGGGVGGCLSQTEPADWSAL